MDFVQILFFPVDINQHVNFNLKLPKFRNWYLYSRSLTCSVSVKKYARVLCNPTVQLHSGIINKTFLSYNQKNKFLRFLFHVGNDATPFAVFCRKQSSIYFKKSQNIGVKFQKFPLERPIF